MGVGVNRCGPVPFFFSPLDKIQELSDISLSLSQSETGAFAMTFKFAFGASSSSVNRLITYQLPIALSQSQR